MVDICTKFALSNTSTTVALSTLDVDRPYRLLRVEKTVTRFGQAMLMTIFTTPQSVAKVFLPKRYISLVSDADISSINDGELALSLVYKGTCPRTGSYILEMCKCEI